MLQHTFEAASRCSVAEGIVVAVDDQRIADEVDAFGGRWIMTSPTCASGTDRIAEVARSMPEVNVFVNVQGDEPEIDPAVIDWVASKLINDSTADMATAGAHLGPGSGTRCSGPVTAPRPGRERTYGAAGIPRPEPDRPQV